MRSHTYELTAEETEPLFLQDAKYDGVVVSCHECGSETELPYILGGVQNDERCGGCKKIFVYRPWWSW